MIETEISCPYCGEPITILVDSSIDHQSYIEDCSVCCRPIQIEVACGEEGELLSVEARQS